MKNDLPFIDPAIITNNTTTMFIIVNILFTSEDSFRPNAKATEK